MNRWFAVYTHPREEELANTNLARQGFTTYWPRYRRRVSHAGRVRDVAASLFPRYLFASFDTSQTGWRTIRSTWGVVDLVRHGFEPVAVPSHFIEDIRRREDDQGQVVLGHQIDFRRGQRINLRGDAFKGHELIFETKKDSERVVAFLSLLGREFQVEVPVENIVPAT